MRKEAILAYTKAKQLYIFQELLIEAEAGKHVAWIFPTHKSAKETYEMIVRSFKDLPYCWEANSTDLKLRIEGGGIIDFTVADERIRGREYTAIMIDGDSEAAEVYGRKG